MHHSKIDYNLALKVQVYSLARSWLKFVLIARSPNLCPSIPLKEWIWSAILCQSSFTKVNVYFSQTFSSWEQFLKRFPSIIFYQLLSIFDSSQIHFELFLLNSYKKIFLLTSFFANKLYIAVYNDIVYKFLIGGKLAIEKDIILWFTFPTQTESFI